MGAQHIDVGFRLRDRDQLKRASPTLADGISEAQEGLLRRELYRTVHNAGRRLTLCAPAFLIAAIMG